MKRFAFVALLLCFFATAPASAQSVNEASKLDNFLQWLFIDDPIGAKIEGTLWQNPLTCATCRAGMFMLKAALDNLPVRLTIEEIATVWCSHNLYKWDVCHGAIFEMGKVVVPQVFKGLLSGDSVCANIMPFCKNPTYRHLNTTEYVQRLLQDKPTEIQDDNYINNLYDQVRGKNRTTFKLVHITDVHTDRYYVEGAISHCPLPQCCRASTGMAKEGEPAAGKWGDVNCDLPPWTFDAISEFIGTEIKPDMVLWTGDNADHNIWDQSFDENMMNNLDITNQLKKYLPSETLVFPTLGNHDAYPVNVEDMYHEERNTLVKGVADSWEQWIGKEAAEELHQRGYYSTVVTASSGMLMNVSDEIRVIALNTNACNGQNWYLLRNSTDPGE